MIMLDMETFESLRGTLLALAYHMLGELAAAEDIVQEVWIKWQSTEKDKIKSPKAWLKKVASNLCLDELSSARSRREHYVGPWLPEPVVQFNEDDPLHQSELAGQCELALLYAMERLTPEERCVYILRQVFDTDYSELAKLLNKTETAIRKMVSRSRKKVLSYSARETNRSSEVASVLVRFLQACQSQDHNKIIALMAEDVVSVSDGGGKVRAALRCLNGADDVSKVWLATTNKYQGEARLDWVTLNSLPGVLITSQVKEKSLLTLRLDENGLISWIYLLRNPDKMRGVL